MIGQKGIVYMPSCLENPTHADAPILERPMVFFGKLCRDEGTVTILSELTESFFEVSEANDKATFSLAG